MKMFYHRKFSHNNFFYNSFPLAIIAQSNNDKVTLMARLLYETRSLPDATMGEIKRIAKELGKDTGFAFVINEVKKEQEKNKNLHAMHFSFSSGKRAYTIIDTPGYNDFVQGMITGGIRVRAVVVIIDASGSVKDQVTGYVPLFNLLCFENLIVLINKMGIDAGQTDFRDMKQEICRFLSHFSLRPPVYIPVSLEQGDCPIKQTSRQHWYKGPCLLDVLDSIQPAETEENKPFRFPVQDVYAIDGKTVIAGRIASGSVKPGDRVVIYPQEEETCITEINIFHKTKVQKARAMENIGIVLDKAVSVKRGNMIAHRNGEVIPVTHLKAHIYWKAGYPLKTGSDMTLLCATQRVPCVAEKIENKINASTLEIIETGIDTMESDEAGIVTLQTEYPVIVEKLSFIEELGRIMLEKDNTVTGTGFI
ncbi:MAG: hypothetical protein JXB88_08055 [Spirochaetales bacterium]|nr:hypothetical protein [Spirochaetales bacterium]